MIAKREGYKNCLRKDLGIYQLLLTVLVDIHRAAKDHCSIDCQNAMRERNYLWNKTYIPRARVVYEIVDIQQGA